MNRQDIRRTVIREWMALPRDKRQSAEQTADFAAKTPAAPHASAQPPRSVPCDDGLVVAADRETVSDAQPAI
jgi:hypothetical protein